MIFLSRKQQDPIKRVREQVGDMLANKEPFSLKPITRSKLREILIKMKAGTSSGYDSIDGKVLKLAAPLMEESLIHLINLSIVTNKFNYQRQLGKDKLRKSLLNHYQL